MKITHGRFGTAALLVSLLAATHGTAPRPGTDVERPETYELDGDRVALFNVAGEITVRGGDVDAVTVEVERRGSDAGRLEVRTGPVEVPDAVLRIGPIDVGLDDDEFDNSLRVVYPDDRVRYDGVGETEIHVRDDGVLGGEGREVRISDDGGLDAHADLTVTVPAGRHLTVGLGAGRVEVANVEGELNLETHAGSIETRDTRGPLHLDTGSGDIRVTGARGPVSADTGSGDVRLTDVSGGDVLADTGSGDVILENVSGGDVRADTGSGEVVLNGIDAGDGEIDADTGSGGVSGTGLRARKIRADTGSGEVELAEVDARVIEADTGSGGVVLDLVSDVDELVADTGSGGVEIAVPDGFGARLDIEAGSGGIDLGSMVRVDHAERGEISGEIGDGDGRVEIDTGSGGVTIRGR